MLALIKTCRLVSLSLLFGGSSAIVFAAVTLVKAAREHGMTVAQAAAYNAPVFVHFGTVALVAAAVLMAAEIIDYQFERKMDRNKLIRYFASFFCFVCAVTFSLGLTPLMEQIRPNINRDPVAHQLFERLHKGSEMVFSGIILCALVSLVMPALKVESKTELKVD